MLHANYFRFYLARHTNQTFPGIRSVASRVQRVERRLDTSIETLLSQWGLDALREQIVPANQAFEDLNDNVLHDLRTAVSRYHEFRQWRLALADTQ